MDQVQTQKPTETLVLQTLKTLKWKKLRYTLSLSLYHAWQYSHSHAGYPKYSFSSVYNTENVLTGCSCGALYMLQNMRKCLLWAVQRHLEFAGGECLIKHQPNLISLQWLPPSPSECGSWGHITSDAECCVS